MQTFSGWTPPSALTAFSAEHRPMFPPRAEPLDIDVRGTGFYVVALADASSNDIGVVVLFPSVEITNRDSANNVNLTFTLWVRLPGIEGDDESFAIFDDTTAAHYRGPELPTGNRLGSPLKICPQDTAAGYVAFWLLAHELDRFRGADNALRITARLAIRDHISRKDLVLQGDNADGPTGA
ncbi:MAG: hypothetical protein ACREL5_03890 [Gemmatimonadales bacterium]